MKRSLPGQMVRPRVLLLAVVALVMLPVGAGCGGDGQTNPGQPAPSSGSPIEPSPSPSATVQPPRWRWLPSAPVPAGHYASVWTGTELLLYHPDFTEAQVGSVGAAYNPKTNKWRKLPSSPYRVWSVEGGYPTVWNGTDMLTWGMMNAAYNPATNRWRALREPAMAGPAVVVWTGRQVLTWGGGCCGDFNANGTAYNPGNDSWQTLPRSPLAGRWGAYGIWTGKEMLVIGGYNDQSRFTDGAAYNPTTRKWRSLPAMPQRRSDAAVVWTGKELILAGGHTVAWPDDRAYADGVAFNPSTNRWRTLPSSGIARFDAPAVWTGSQVLVWGGRNLPRDAKTDAYAAPPHGVIYDPATNTWSAMPISMLRARTEAAAVWTGTEMVIWGGRAARSLDDLLADGAAFRPGGVTSAGSR